MLLLMSVGRAFGQPTPCTVTPDVEVSALASSSAASVLVPNYQPTTGRDRMRWVTVSTVGATSLATGALSVGWGTLFNLPSEYGTRWEGFGKRYGMRLTGIATGSLMEAGPRRRVGR